MLRFPLFVLALGCTGKPDDQAPGGDADTDSDTDTDTDTDADTDTDTDLPAPAEVLAADCALTENSLRVSCSATLEAFGSVSVAFTAAGQATREFTAEGEGEVALLGWGLAPETAYDWSIGTFSGTVTTGALPAALAGAQIETTGTAWGFDAVLYPLVCPGDDYFTMIDGTGQIVWYEMNDVYFQGIMTGYDWSQSSLTVLSTNGDRFQEQHVSGDVVLELTGGGVDFAEVPHHDVDRWGDYRYVLFEYLVGGLWVDGIDVFDGDVRVGTFLLEDHFAVPLTGNGDYFHSNGLKVSDTGEMILSVHVFHSVVSIDGDPASPTFLEVNWVANGSDGGLPAPDYLPVAGDGFLSQHNASRHGDDLWLFDNKGEPESRAVRMAIDEIAGTLTETGSWSFATTCDNQGGAIPLDGGGVLASCANTAQVWAFEESAALPGWTLEANCGEEAGRGSLPILRGIPVEVR